MTPLHVNSLSLEQYLALHFAPLWLGAFCILVPILIACLGLVVIRRVVPSEFLQLHHEITGPFFNTMGAIYGIFLALIVATTWQFYSNTEGNVVEEARCLGSLYSDAEAFPQPHRAEFRKLISEYRSSLISDEWKSLGKGCENDRTAAIFAKLKGTYSRFKVSDTAEGAYFHESVRNLNRMESLRASRIQDAGSGLIPFLWGILIAGAAAMIGFSFLFGAQNFATHAVMTSLLTAVIGLAFFTIMTLDFPFTGLVAIDPSAFVKLELK